MRRFHLSAIRLVACAFIAVLAIARAEDPAVSYPYPVQYFTLDSHGRSLRMAYMETGPADATAKPLGTVVLFHGKNFPAAYWQGPMAALSKAGYRVIAPEQIGFGHSDKPEQAYSFHQLATNSRKLLEHLKVPRVLVVGHSMGGMLATRFALMFPDYSAGLVLANPIGLEDYRVEVPYLPTDEVAEQTRAKTEAAILKYHQGYYAHWRPEYAVYAQAQFQLESGAGAYVSALTTQMIYEQPVCYEFPRIRVPTLLIIGQSDRTVIGKDRLSKEVASTLGNYPELGRRTAKAIPNARLVELPDVGHLPHLEAAQKFNDELLRFARESFPSAQAAK